MLRPTFSPVAPMAIAAALTALWFAAIPALTWLLPRTDALIGRIIP